MIKYISELPIMTVIMLQTGRVVLIEQVSIIFNVTGIDHTTDRVDQLDCADIWYAQFDCD